VAQAKAVAGQQFRGLIRRWRLRAFLSQVKVKRSPLPVIADQQRDLITGAGRHGHQVLECCTAQHRSHVRSLPVYIHDGSLTAVPVPGPLPELVDFFTGQIEVVDEIRAGGTHAMGRAQAGETAAINTFVDLGCRRDFPTAAVERAAICQAGGLDGA
jgi:hypothetical protein